MVERNGFSKLSKLLWVIIKVEILHSGFSTLRLHFPASSWILQENASIIRDDHDDS